MTTHFSEQTHIPTTKASERSRCSQQRDHSTSYVGDSSPPAVPATCCATDCRPRRTFLHLSYSYALPFGPPILVNDPSATLGVHCTNRFSHYQRASFSGYNAVPVIGFLHAGSPDPNVNLSFRNSGAPVRKDDPEAVPECDQVTEQPAVGEQRNPNRSRNASRRQYNGIQRL